MKNKILTAVVVILLGGVVIWRMATSPTSNFARYFARDNSSSTEESSEASQNSNNSDDNSKDDTTTDVTKISGFTSEEGSGSESGGDNSSSSNNGSSSSDNNSNNGSSSNNTNSTNNGNNSSDKNNNNSGKNNSKSISLPYTIASTGMKIKSIGQYSGSFVEDGSDKSVSNVLSIVVTNTSGKDLQYGEIKLKAGSKTATFKLTNVPSGKSVLALETSGMKYSSGTNYTYAEATYAQTNMSMNSGKVSVSTEDSKVTIKNISGKDLGTVYVYYKNLDKSGAYLGGITYRVKFDDVKKGDTLTQSTKHFSKSNSKIIMVDTEN
ncbi:hypothetical protein [Intestinibacter bartlettii]|uniref:Uncharacterized protein n=1 Tax=Intestinibacter bartlettii TaxID=261299 RepID=A0ABS6DZI9_9FIRM|nr:hypothetical protein [Intestinibacter bartlettii]MBU5337260.1 hypothetical protein [Intestinibacter bartlettii]